MNCSPFLVLQLRPEDQTADDELRAILEHGALRLDEVERIRVERVGVPEFDLERYAAIIVGGSPFDVSTPEADKSELQRRIERGFDRLLTSVVARDKPFLGACSGSGLFGNWLGATVSRRFGEPVGGADIEMTQAGILDPLLAGLPRTFRALVGHKEACDDTPPGAALLASSAGCKVQMFRVKRNVYATQFHPEGDVEGFVLRIETYRHNGYFAPDAAEALIRTIENEHAPVPRALLRRFVERYRHGR